MAGAMAAQTIMQIKSANKTAEMNGKAAYQANKLNQRQLARAQEETADKADLEAMERQRQGMRERGRIQAANSAAGIGGNLSLMHLSNSFFQEGYDNSIIDSDANDAIQSIQGQREASQMTAESRIASAENQAVNPFMGGLMIGGSAASGYATGKDLSRKWR